MTDEHLAPRPWHVSQSLVAPRATRPTGRGASPSGKTEPAAKRGRALAATLGGQGRRVLHGLLWRRRRVAQRTMSSLERHPEFRDVLASDGVVRLMQLSVRSARSRSRSTPPRRYLPIIDVPAGLDITDLAGSTALSGVRTRAGDNAAATHRAYLRGDLISVDRLGDRSGETDTLRAAVEMLDAVDVSRWNPQLFRTTPNAPAIRLDALPTGGGRRKDRERVTLATRSVAVLCDPSTSRGHTTHTARLIAQLATAGAPLAGTVSDEIAALIGRDVAAAIAGAQPDELTDDARREQHSIAVRRAALATLSPRGRWDLLGEASGTSHHRAPSVTVLLASNRPDDVVAAARQVAAQRGVQVQLVVGLHGAHMSSRLDDELAAVFPGELVVRHVADTRNLGQVLNELTDVADGDLVTKWDDDDWYDPRHITDLVLALEYSGATMVAKPAEFVYLESIDLTVRRFASGSERFSTTVAGGTLLLQRDELQHLRWADAPRRVDRLLIDAIEARGGTVYRTHGFGYVLRRRGGALNQHTWQAGDAYFLRQSGDQRPGLDLSFAGFGDVAERSADAVTS